jgi:hypothetical protein
MAKERKVGSPPRTVYQTFTGLAATDWLMDCCSTVERREASEFAGHFLEQELIWCVQPDLSYLGQFALGKENEVRFQPTKYAIYQLSQKGKDVVHMTPSKQISESENTSATTTMPGVPRDSNTRMLDRILNDAALRLLFREHLRDTLCEENLLFYLDVNKFLQLRKVEITANLSSSGNGAWGNLDSAQEALASAYTLYNAFLAPGSPCELNIGYLLRNQLAIRMTQAAGQDAAIIESLTEISKLFEQAQISVFKLMASVSLNILRVFIHF